MRHSRVLLTRQFQHYKQHPIEGISFELQGDDLHTWDVTIFGPQGTPLEGGVFKAVLNFPDDYPMSPPKMKFLTPMFNPNIYPSGEVCISILHSPGDTTDILLSGERPEERWSPVQTPESICLSVISMLVDPNPESPANVDAAVAFREDRKSYEQKVRRLAQRSIEELP
ncbi:hypothetical protein P9112_005479 [Eukaryota sp. TZLM1-RC]